MITILQMTIGQVFQKTQKISWANAYKVIHNYVWLQNKLLTIHGFKSTRKSVYKRTYHLKYY